MIEFDDFVYGRLGGFAGAAAGEPVTARPVSWFIGWLARDPDYAPQPYRQLARVLAEAGETEKAGDVLYAGRERERRGARGLASVGLTLLDLTVGYGYGQRYFRTLWWVAAFVALGVLVLHVTGEARRNAMPFGVAFSLDMLLPIVRLRDVHYAIDLQGVARYYFYLHKTMGYVLASFLVAGLAGLTS